MSLDITHCLELQQLLFLDADAETGVGFDQNFVEAEGVNPNVSIRRASEVITAGSAPEMRCRISTRRPSSCCLSGVPSSNTYNHLIKPKYQRRFVYLSPRYQLNCW